jgi:thioredoxin-related protein
MKKLFVFAVLSVMVAVFAKAQKPQVTKWYTFAQALELQKTQPRKIIVDIYTDWCGWCKRMDAETFSHPVISELLNNNFYAVKFNAEGNDTIFYNNYKFINPGGGKRSTHQFATALFQAQKLDGGYPSIAYFDENMQLIRVNSGYWDAPKMEVYLHYLMDNKYKPTALEEYQKTFISKIK